LLFWSLLLLLSLLTFNANDPSLNHVVSGKTEIQNKAGLFGAYAAGFLNDVFGVAAFLWPLVFGALGAACVSSSYAMHWWRWCGFFLLTLCLLVVSSFWDISLGDLRSGGMVGEALYAQSSRYLSPGGSAIVWFFVLMIGIQLTCNLSWFGLAARGRQWVTEYRSGKAAPSTVTDDPEEPNAGMPQQKGQGRDDWKNLLQRGRVWLMRFLPKPAAHTAPRSTGQTMKSHIVMDDDEPFALSEELDLFEIAPVSEPEVAAKQSPSAPLESSSSVPVFSRDVSTHKEDILPEIKDNLTPETVVQMSSPSVPASKQVPLTLENVKAPVPLPPLELLSLPVKAVQTNRREDLEARGEALMACLKDFGVQGRLVRITPGPVVTMYEVRPAPGIRVNRIANLSDDLALALKAIAVRIQAPIPGSDTVGIEIPNGNRETVNFRELAASDSFRKGCGPLTMILGKDIAGQPYMADLTRMPHLLVAGATGAGKSVCLNGILVSLLYRAQPKDLRLLLIDPKRIEMAVYADAPHLVHPVVTEMAEAKNALDWAVHEMDCRYKAMARLGVRNMSGYNQKLAAYKNELPSDLSDLEPLPYLVIVIDELADLMMTAAREVETSIVRLAQLARAAGIHMILATQRPSVDVVTGLIKANFPCRISFQVTSKHDSRTILDQVGAEHLLGRGDMLYKPSGGRLQRLHGPFLSDEEVQSVVEHWKHYLRPSYQVDFAQWGGESAGIQASGSSDNEDPLYQEIQAFVIEQGKASISLVQRRFKIGFNRAARLVEQLEQDGIVGPADGSKVRTVR